MSTAISSGYVARSEARARTLERERAQLGSDLLAGAFPTYDAAKVRSLELGIEIPPRLGFLLLPSSGPAHAVVAAEAGKALPSALVAPMAWDDAPHTVLIVPVPNPSAWESAQRVGAALAERFRLTAVSAGPCEGPQAWHDRYAEGAVATRLASVFTRPGCLVNATELMPAAFVQHATPAAIAGVEREIIRPLTEHRKFKKLLRYIDAIMQCEGSPKNAASRMGVAVHTARTYRGTIEQATGRSFDRPGDALWFGLGWLVARLRYGEFLEPDS